MKLPASLPRRAENAHLFPDEALWGQVATLVSEHNRGRRGYRWAIKEADAWLAPFEKQHAAYVKRFLKSVEARLAAGERLA